MASRKVGIRKNIVLVLVPGAFKDSELFWETPKRSLDSLGYQCYLVNYKMRDKKCNQPPYKGLGVHSLENDVFDCRLQVKSAREEFGPDKKYILVGYSKSGLVGQILAEEKGLFDGLVAINPPVPKGFSSVTPSALWWTKDILLQIIFRFSFRIPVKKSYRNFVGGHLPPGVREKDAKKFFRKLVWESGQVIWDLAFRKPKLNPLLASCPFLFFASRADRIVKCSSVGEVFDWHCKSRKDESARGMHLSVLDGAHYPFIGSQKKQVVNEIDQWILQNF